MKIVNHKDINPVTQKSPKETFYIERRHISEAMGVPRDAGLDKGGHPFEVEHVSLPAGKRNFPLHTHAAQYEFYYILSGKGMLETESDSHELRAGDSVMLAPGEAHSFYNPYEAPLEYLVIADNPPADIAYYPKSKKWGIKPGRIFFRESVDYYDGEE